MKETFPNRKEWVYRYFTNFSLHQLNNVSIVFILMFTVLFSLLLIHDEYQLFETMLQEQKHEYFENQKRIIITDAELFANLFEQVYAKRGSAGLEELTDTAATERSKFIMLYDRKMQLVTDGVKLHDLQRIDFDADPTQLGIAGDGVGESVLLYRHRLSSGYYVLSGVYMSPYDEMLEVELSRMKTRLIRIILEIATLSFILFGFILGVSQIVNSMLENDVQSFQEFFERVAQRYEVLNHKTLFFKEFKTMGLHANAMVDTIVEQKASLERLNLTLEDKVRDKTARLQEKNSALQREKEFSQDLLTSQKQFVRYAIHETNTPLSVIVTNIELYTMQHGKDPYLSKVEAAVKNIFNIYDDLSYLVKKDQIDYPPQCIDLCEYLQARVEFFDEVAQFAGVSFEYRCDTEQSTVRMNETKLQRIVDNNLTNAIKYTRHGEVIHVNVSDEMGSVLFSVASPSAVIEDIDRVFEAYYRERKKNDGFGLGLNLVKSICDEEDVDITISSTEEETRFTYRFKVGVA